MASIATASSSAADEDASVALCRQLMEEEAMASYSSHLDIVRTNISEIGNDMTSEDQAVLHRMILEDQEFDADELEYEEMLELGEQLGNVKHERWRHESAKHIASLPCRACTASDGKCLVCQEEFTAEGEESDVRELPCKHVFHRECIDEWLANDERCPTCKRSIRGEGDQETVGAQRTAVE
jgi:hypothetical protein